MQVAHIAGDVQRCDLSLSISHLVEPSRQTIDNEASVIHPLTGGHDVPVSSDLRCMAWQVEDGILLIFGKT